MNLIETILLENINKPNSLFIFPTDTAASRWADHLLRLKGGTIAMNKFTAWDKFKQNSVKSKVLSKSSIPSALRKIFVSRLIRENAETVTGNKTPVFTSLIQLKWAENADHFTSWLTNLLPQLGMWFQKTTGISVDAFQNDELLTETEKAAETFDDDERDMFTLAKRYAQFLTKYNLFEPAWEEPPFNNDGKDCFLFFPESLSDYGEYRRLLASSSHVKIISVTGDDSQLKQCVPQSGSFYYTNARREITEASLYIRALHEKQNIAWDSIAVCAADSEGYEPYLIRELENRNIPYVKRISTPLSEYPAGRFFGGVLECVSQNYSFSSLVSLITNKNLPWKDTGLVDNLIQFGIKNNCLYSWTEKKDGKEIKINVWEDALKNPLGGIEPACLMFFNSLKTRLNTLRTARSFSELRRQYFIFRETFFDMDNCADETDIVLSRCIAELMNLAELEKNFPELLAVDPFLFFTGHLNETNYLAQTKTSGISILPYKTAAASPFDCHIILGAGQKNLSVIFKKLDFLSGKKREKLNIHDEDASDAYINLHKFNSLKYAAFFCSEQAFSGYSIPHSKTNAPSKPKETYISGGSQEFFAIDNYRNESLSENQDRLLLHEIQKSGFEKWIKRREQIKEININNKSDKILDFIQKRLVYKKEGFPDSEKFTGKYSVSSSSLNKYYKCSVSWYFDYILGLDSAEIETNLMPENLSGIVYHSVIEKFLSNFKEEPLPAPDITEKGVILPVFCRQLLKNNINEVFDGFKSISASSLSARFLNSEKEIYYFNLEKSLARFLSFFSGSKVSGCEKWYQTPRDKFYLNGKIDCILSDKENGKNIIVDFKMAALPKRGDCICDEENELCDFQLPMYITLTEENENIEISAALFYSILMLKTEVITGRVHDIVTDNYYPNKEENCIYRKDETYNQLIKIFNKKTQKFADELISGVFSVYETDSKICLSCRFNSICRKFYVIKNEKNLLLGKNK